MESCKKYNAQYIDGDDSVRKKRNKGIRMSKYDTILFIDSDVTVEKGLLDEYVEAYKNPYKVKLGGVLGYSVPFEAFLNFGMPLLLGLCSVYINYYMLIYVLGLVLICAGSMVIKCNIAKIYYFRLKKGE